MKDLITIKAYLTTHEAYVLRGQLESHGIVCFLKNEAIVNSHAIFSDATGQIDLQVSEKDYERALKIIGENL